MFYSSLEANNFVLNCRYIKYMSVFDLWPSGAEAGIGPSEPPSSCADVWGSPDGDQFRWPVSVRHHRPLLRLLSSFCGYRRVKVKSGHSERTGCQLNQVRICWFFYCFRVWALTLVQIPLFSQVYETKAEPEPSSCSQEDFSVPVSGTFLYLTWTHTLLILIQYHIQYLPLFE